MEGFVEMVRTVCICVYMLLICDDMVVIGLACVVLMILCDDRVRVSVYYDVLSLD